MGANLFDQLLRFETKPWKSSQGVTSLITFFVGAFLLGISVFLGLIFVTKIFLLDSVKGIEFVNALGLGFLFPDKPGGFNIGEVVILGLVFLVGMVVSLVSIRIFSNQALQKVANVYAWLCAAFSLVVYWRIANNYSERAFDFDLRFSVYFLAIGIVIGAVYALPFLFDRYELRMYSVPVFIGAFMHLLLMLVQYVILGKTGDLSSAFVFRTKYVTSGVFAAINHPELSAPNPSNGPDSFFFWGNLLLFAVMIIIAISFVRDAPFFAAIKRGIDRVFPHAE